MVRFRGLLAVALVGTLTLAACSSGPDEGATSTTVEGQMSEEEMSEEDMSEEEMSEEEMAEEDMSEEDMSEEEMSDGDG